MVNLLTIENVTLLIALWGAILATYKVISDYSKNARKIRVRIFYGILTQGNAGLPRTIQITAQNIGNRTVTLTSAGYILPDKKYISIIVPHGSIELPHTLDEGKQCSIWQTQKELAEDLKEHGYSGKIKLTGYYGSAIGKTWKSKPTDFDIEETLALKE
jgi:hypothetical protein